MTRQLGQRRMAKHCMEGQLSLRQRRRGRTMQWRTIKKEKIGEVQLMTSLITAIILLTFILIGFWFAGEAFG
jgi:hypothetical protein